MEIVLALGSALAYGVSDFTDGVLAKKAHVFTVTLLSQLVSIHLRPFPLGRLVLMASRPVGALCIVDDELIDAVWEPIVSRAQWESVRERRRRDGRRTRQLREAKGGPSPVRTVLLWALRAQALPSLPQKHSQRIYVCVDPKGHRCVGGSVDCSIADDFRIGQPRVGPA